MNPPRPPTTGVSNSRPLFIQPVVRSKDDEVVEKLCRARCDLTDMPASAFQMKDSAALFHGSLLRLPVPVTLASFSVDVRVGSADIDLDVVYQNESYGKASINFE